MRFVAKIQVEQNEGDVRTRPMSAPSPAFLEDPSQYLIDWQSRSKRLKMDAFGELRARVAVDLAAKLKLVHQRTNSLSTCSQVRLTNMEIADRLLRRKIYAKAIFSRLPPVQCPTGMTRKQKNFVDSKVSQWTQDSIDQACSDIIMLSLMVCNDL